MKRSRAIAVGSVSASLVAIGWASGAGIGGPAHATSAAPAAADSASTSATAATAGSATPTQPAGSTTASAAPSTAASPTGVSGTFDGSPVDTAYGPFQVEITVSNGTITDIAMLQEGDGDRHSQRINDFAVPQLTAEVLDAQSARVSAVSGASFTSEGVLQSIASAIQQAGL